jgi:hypothetical protein
MAVDHVDPTALKLSAEIGTVARDAPGISQIDVEGEPADLRRKLHQNVASAFTQLCLNSRRTTKDHMQ